MGRRQFMNVMAFGTVTGVALGALYPVVRYFIPPSAGGEGEGVVAKDKLGKPIDAGNVAAEHDPGDRVLTQGIDGDPTYVMITEDESIASYGLNAVCTHLGCIVPWDGSQNKFVCPCHGSQYDATGKVVRGPAPKSLALVNTEVTEGNQIVYTPWEETDFRTGQAPWWT